MKLGIDGDALRRPLSGVGKYIYNLCSALEPLLSKDSLFAYSRHHRQELALPSSRWQLRREPVPLLRKLPSFSWLKTRGRSMCMSDELDVFWAGRTLHPGLPPSVRTLCTVHDLNHLIVPETMRPPTYWSHRLWFEKDLRNCQCILANSRGTSHRLKTLLGLHSDALVLPGVSQAFRPLNAAELPDAQLSLAEFGIGSRYILAVGTMEPRKNLPLLLRTFLDLKRRGSLAGHQLVLCGARGWQDSSLRKEFARAVPEGLVLPGYVPEERMPTLVGAADVVVVPSLYEGFGMTALEARSCGVPTVISEIPELREAAGTEAISADLTEEALGSAIVEALRRPRRLVALSLPEFSWQFSAEVFAEQIAQSKALDPVRFEAPSHAANA